MNLIEERYQIANGVGKKPTKRPRFCATDFEAAFEAAVRASAFSGAPCFVYPTYNGMRVEAAEPKLPLGHTIFRIDATYNPESEAYTVHAWRGAA